MRKIQFLFFVFFLPFGFGVFEEKELFAQEDEQRGSLELSRQYNEEGARLFAEGRFCEAARGFEKALKAFPKSEAVFNAAFAWERCGEIDKALRFYQEYLEIAPDNEREKIAAKITELETKIAEKIESENKEGEEVAVGKINKDPKESYSFLKWAGVVAFFSFFGVAAGLNADAVSRAGEINRRSLKTFEDWKRYRDDFERARTEQIAAYVFYGLTGAVAVGTAILWYLDSRPGDRGEQENSSSVGLPLLSFGKIGFSISF